MLSAKIKYPRASLYLAQGHAFLKVASAQAHCVQAMRPAGLSIEEGVRKLCYLVQRAVARQLTGVNLKDDKPSTSLPFGGDTT